MDPNNGIDFSGIFQLIILVLIIVWYVYNISRQARKVEEEELAKKNKTDNTKDVINKPQAKKPVSQDPGVDLLKEIFGVSMPDIVREPKEIEKPKAISKAIEETNKKIEVKKAYSEKNLRERKKVEQPDKIEQIKKQNIEAKKKSLISASENNSPLHFSDDPYIQAIIVSEVLGKPKGLMD